MEQTQIVLDSNYVISLSEMDESLIDKIKEHDNIDQQYDEWLNNHYIKDIELDNIDPENYPFLPIDTKYFDSLREEIIDSITNLDRSMDGLLIKSDNYQALNTLKDKYDDIKLIYIDPPYNTEDDEFIYKDKMKHSSWLTMMETGWK